MKPFATNSRSDSPSTQISPAGFPSRAAASDLQLQPSNLSPRLHPGHRLADSKSHHRQTSIVHGIQHSRNGSYASSNSPLSPQIIAAAGGERPDASNMGDPAFASAMSMSSMNSGASFSSNTTLVPERGSTATDVSSNTQKRVERMHSGRSRRDHGHHHSHSRHHHKGELKTVGEYALHVLFTSVSSFNMCLYRRPNNAFAVYRPSGREDFSMHHYPH